MVVVAAGRNNNNNKFDIFFSGISLNLKEHGCQAKICFETTTAAAVVVVIVPNEAANVRSYARRMKRNAKKQDRKCKLWAHWASYVCVCVFVCASEYLSLLLLARWLVGWNLLFFLSFRSKNVH